jgi:hypothetical protein
LPGTVADVEHVDLLLLLHDAVDYAVHVRLVAKEQVSVVTVFWRHRAAVGAASQGANGVPEAAISGKSRIRRTCINPVIEAGKIPLCGGMILIRYAMRGFECCEELLGVAALSLLGLLNALADAFVSVGAGCDIEQSLIRSGILDDGFGLALHSEHHWPLALLEVLHKIPRSAAKRRERLNVLGDIKHGELLL